MALGRTRLFLIAVLLAYAPWALAAGATSPSIEGAATIAASPPVSRLRRFANRIGLGQTGAVVTAELHAGVGVTAVAGVGLRIRPGLAGADVFAMLEGDLLIPGVRFSVSPNPELTGVEWSVGPVAFNSPLYRNRVVVQVIPGALAIFAGRTGGLGFQLNAFPLALLPPPFDLLTRAGVSVYVTDPRLAPVANWTLDRVDQGIAYAKRIGERAASLGRRLRPARSRPRLPSAMSAGSAAARADRVSLAARAACAVRSLASR
jgi:hypothetical protein